MATGNTILGLKHLILSGRLAEAKKLLAAAKLSLEECLDEDSNTPLHWCALGLEVETEKREATEQETVAFLLQNGAPRNRQNCLGETPLMLAVRQATLEPKRADVLVNELLKKAVADPRRPDMVGETPLMMAAAAGLDTIGKCLLEARANPLAESSSGMTAKTLAQESGYTDFVQLLKSPLAVRAAKEAEAAAAVSPDSEDQGMHRERKARKFEQTLFGQKLRPGLAHDKDAPGKPYPEYGTLHDID